MPIYEFLCRDCDHRYDDLVGFNEDVEDQVCSECTSHDIVKLYSPFKVGKKAGVGIDGTQSYARAPGACLPGEPGNAAGAGSGLGRKAGCCGGSCGAC
ncbi:MAG: zinc ribbon domain-containing protein [Thermoleophilia bacterium]|nr:zinc ribbon domain-containing protein [Thermoleophilia bacterium]